MADDRKPKKKPVLEEVERAKERHEQATPAQHGSDGQVDESVEESFPASDPPAHSGPREHPQPGGSPQRPSDERPEREPPEDDEPLGDDEILEPDED